MSFSSELAARYEQDLREREFTPDPGQQRALAALAALGDRLAERPTTGFLSSLKQRFRPAVDRNQGLYLWGGVGRGKTYLVDLFFDALPITQKRRCHFHRFMQDTHEQLGALEQHQNPLVLIAKRIAADTRVLCFDEFFVSDIGDAMILATLLETLFANGVTLVATSNVAPQDLYYDGLQRQRFLPAIELLQQHTTVMDIGDGADYRLRVLESAEIYLHPPDAGAERKLAQYFADIAPDRVRAGIMLQIANRLIAAKRCADGIAWFDFAELCTSPRSAKDYLELARLYHTVLLSGLPVLNDDRDDDARRFIALVDVLYDHHVKLFISAAAAPCDIYTGQRLAFEYRRTQSRLQEMQHIAYLALPHLA